MYLRHQVAATERNEGVIICRVGGRILLFGLLMDWFSLTSMRLLGPLNCIVEGTFSSLMGKLASFLEERYFFLKKVFHIFR